MVVTRFAPSPTGYLHIGGLRTALFSYLWAKKNNGKFILRIEDTDKQRNDEDAAKAIVDAFKWAGMDNDGEIFYQSDRTDIYKSYISKLLDEGKAYKCYMSKDELSELRKSQEDNNERTRYDNRYRNFTDTPPSDVIPVIRLIVDDERTVVFTDGVKGNVSFKATDMLDDFIIARSDGSPTYNFVVAIDDHLMGINQVIRGDDHLSNTPKQILVYEALGFDVPKYFHVPLIHGPNGKKLSKSDGATDVMEYDVMGYPPEVILNFLIRLGWSYGDQEIFSIDEMIELFNPNDINKSASTYSVDKLNWLNAQYLKTMDNAKIEDRLSREGIDLSNIDDKNKLLDFLKVGPNSFKDLANIITNIINTPVSYDPKGAKKAFSGEFKEVLTTFKNKLIHIDKIDTPVEYHDAMKDTVEFMNVGFGKIGMPLRMALLGETSGPALDIVMSIIGVDETIARIDAVLSLDIPA